MDQKTSALWYIAGNFVGTCSTLFISIATIRILGADTAGIVSFHFAMAILFAAVGKFGVRNFQISDTRKEFSSDEYRMQRLLSISFMLLLSIFYVLKSYSWRQELFVPILYIYFIKSLDAYIDVIEGELQREQRLKTSGQVALTRVGGYTANYVITLYFTKDLKLSIVLALFYAIIISCIHYAVYVDMYLIPILKKMNVFRITKSCLPLCLSEFLLLMIGNIPKSVINQNLTGEYQAYYSCISFPSQFVPMCVQFIFGASLVFLSIYFERHETENIKHMLRKDFIFAGSITVFAVLCGFLFGIPVLNFIYGVSLDSYKGPFLLILLGSGCNAGLIISNGILTIIRKQEYMFSAYLISILMMILAISFFKQATVWTAAFLYSGGMACAFFISSYCALHKLKKYFKGEFVK